jgi:PPP family 3-phenylpropionic acid transporter
MPLTETLAVAGVRAGGLDYGRVRLWGSLTFIAVGFIAGALIDSFGSGVCIWLLAAGAGTTVAAAHRLPHTAIAGPRPAPAGSLSLSEALKLVRSKAFLTFLLAVGAVQGAHATFYTFGALNWQAQGISSSWVGGLWSIGVLAEVAVFAYSGMLIAYIPPARLLTFGAAAAVLRWSLMSLAPPLAALVPLQVLHGLTYGAAHVAAIHFIARAVPPATAGTAQALYATMAAGIVMGAATLVSGPLYARLGAGAYVFAALLASLGFVAAVTLMRTWSGGLLWAEPVSPTAPEREVE